MKRGWVWVVSVILLVGIILYTYTNESYRGGRSGGRGGRAGRERQEREDKEDRAYERNERSKEGKEDKNKKIDLYNVDPITIFSQDEIDRVRPGPLQSGTLNCAVCAACLAPDKACHSLCAMCRSYCAPRQCNRRLYEDHVRKLLKLQKPPEPSEPVILNHPFWGGGEAEKEEEVDPTYDADDAFV